MSYGSSPLRAGRAEQTLRDAIAQGAVFGTFQLIGHPAVTEILAVAGAEVVVADAEHGAFGIETLEQLVRAGDVRGASVVIRVLGPDAHLGSALDTGAAGIVVPRVESADEARTVVRGTRFPPLGARGLGAGRATVYGLDLAGHRAIANDDLLVVAMVETMAGLAAVDEIVAVDGIDVILVGPADLASSLGVPFGSDEHAAAITRIIDAARSAGRQVGIHCADVAEAAAYRSRGVRLLLIGTDASFLAAAASANFLPALPFTDERPNP
ncbi:HpcH/HpaI aldolase family protein [Glaciibacter sp. 2TAF33]|uniref:HpcH/HpaI aldolase family protein n=1 Tax=Glaciibacter sp. 2TAF33 TaxID=3233015 RepID=UPI003F8E9A8E